MKSRHKKGDLVYVPSQVNLYNIDSSGAVIDYFITKRPINLLIIEEHDKAYEVIHGKKKWLVNKKNVYGGTK